MRIAIDGIWLLNQPHEIEFTTQRTQGRETASRKLGVQPGSDNVVVNCRWGKGLTWSRASDELERLYQNHPVHAITLEVARGKFMTINALWAPPNLTEVGYLFGGSDLAVGPFSVQFYQADADYLFALRLPLPGILEVRSPYTFRYAPAAGRIILIEGWLRDLGSGTGQTRVQVSNYTRTVDYLSTEGDFVCGSETKRLQNHVLGDDLDFYGGDRLDINVTDIPTGGLSKDGWITIWASLGHP